MSTTAIAWAFGVNGLTTVQKFLLVAIADYADENHSCFPGQESLAERICATRQTVSKNLSELESLGLLMREERRRGDGYRTSDRFILAVGSTPTSCRDASRKDGLRKPTSRKPEADLMSGKSRSHVRQTGGQRSEPSEEPPVEPSDTHALTLIDPGELVESTDAAFERAYAAWPKKVNRKTAKEKFARAIRRHPGLAEDIIRFGNAYAETTERQFVPALDVWINKEKWTDELPSPRRDNYRQVTHLDVINRLEAEHASQRGGEAPAVRELG